MDFFNAENVVKRFSNHLALDSVTVGVPHNSIFGLLGPNGAGKTTLIRIINQITAPDSGKVFLKGKPLKGDDVRNIGYLPEERGLYKKMKVGEQALYLVQLKGVSKQDGLKKLKYWFEKFGIEGWWDKKVEELSKGMAQKVQFIVTVLHEPELLIFDEPFSGFDPINANIIKEEILELRKKGSTIIFSTHNMGSVEELCDHIALINNGQTILDGQIDKIRTDFRPDTYKLQYRGREEDLRSALSIDFEIDNTQQNDELNEASIRHINGLNTRELVNKINPVIDIVSFEEVRPSMNDIFIRVVEGSNKSKNSSNPKSRS